MIRNVVIGCLFTVLTVDVLAMATVCAEPLLQSGVEPLARIEASKIQGKITIDQAALYKLALFSQPEELPEEFQSATPVFGTTDRDRLDGLVTLAHIYAIITEDWELLSAETQQAIEAHFSPQAQAKKSAELQHDLPDTWFTAHFAIHWNSDPANPDYPTGGFQYIEVLSNTLEANWDALTASTGLGYAAPVLPVTPLPVYVANTIEFGWITLPPTAWAIGLPDQIQIRNNLNLADLGTTGLHELFHVFQWDYADKDSFDFSYYSDNCWWMEATAVWMEHHVHGTDYIGYIRQYIDYPHRSLTRSWEPFGTQPEDHPEYGVVIFAKYLQEHIDDLNTMGDNWNVIREVWTEVIQVTDHSCLTALENVLTRYGYTLHDFFVHFTAANYYHVDPNAGYQDGGSPNWPKVKVENEHQHNLSLTFPPATGRGDVAPLGASYVEIEADLPYHHYMQLKLDFVANQYHHDVRMLLFGPNLTAPDEQVITGTFTYPDTWEFTGNIAPGFGTVYTKAVMIVNNVEAYDEYQMADIAYGYDLQLQAPTVTSSATSFAPCRVSTLSTENNAQYPAVTYNSVAEEHWVVWNLYKGVGQSYLQGQRVRRGLPVSTPFTLTAPLWTATRPALEYDSRNNRVLAAWIGSFGGATHFPVYAQLWTSDGVSITRPVVLSDQTVRLYHIDAPAVAYNPTAAEFLTIWAHEHYIYGQRLAATGGVTVGHNLTLTAYYTEVAQPAVAYNPDSHEYLFMYMDRSHIDSQLWRQRLDAQGNLLGAPALIATLVDTEARPQVIYNPNAQEYLAVWRDKRWHSLSLKTDIYAQRIGADGTLLDNAATAGIDESAAGVNFAVGYADCTDAAPSVTYDLHCQEYLIAWQRSVAGQPDIYLQRVAAAGQLLDTSFLYAVGAGEQLTPLVSYDPANRNALVVWHLYQRDVPSTRMIQAAMYPDTCVYLPVIQK